MVLINKRIFSAKNLLLYECYIGVATIYAKTHLLTHLNQNITKSVWKSNSNVSNSNFGRGL